MRNFKAIMFIAALLCLIVGAEADAQPLGLVPYPNHIVPKDGQYAVHGTNVFIDSSLEGRTKDVITEFTDRLHATSGSSGKVAIVKSVPNRGISFALAGDCPAEGYRLKSGKKGVCIEAGDHNGFVYALETLKQLLPVAIYGNEAHPDADWSLPALEIEDAPQFAYRGMHLDVARHFFTVDEVKRYIDIMRLHKQNTLHWHLTDDQGWRIEIKRYPRLTEVGSIRKTPNGGYGGYYTQEQIREVIAYADRYGITVIPEVDLPGHMLAAIASYPELGCRGEGYEVWRYWGISRDVLCVGKERTFEFLEGVLTEVMELFPSKFIHVGGDECPKQRWKECPHCQKRIAELGLKDDDKYSKEHYLQSYTMVRIEKFLNGHGRNIIGWDEILEGEVAPNAVIMSWRGSKGGIAAAKLGHDVIMTPNTHFYFDYQQRPDKSEPGAFYAGHIDVRKVYSFNPEIEELSPQERKHIIGIQANLWTEHLPTVKLLDYMILPRIDALSEVQWCNPQVRSWKRFRSAFRMDKIYDVLGYNYARHIYDMPAE